MIDFLTIDTLLLLSGGILIGIFAVIIGGGMFFSIPFTQWLFPEISFGAIIGNIKVGSFFRGIGSTASTHKHINYIKKIHLSALAFLGTIIGVSCITNISQKALFPAILFAIALGIIAPKITHLITQKTFYISTFFIGLYAGIFGAGLGILLIALLRTKYPDKKDIAHVKIQARFIEFLLVIVAVITHIIHGNLLAPIWIPWAVGGIIGGYLGGKLLHKIGTLSGKTQSYLLYTAFFFAAVVAGINSY